MILRGPMYIIVFSDDGKISAPLIQLIVDYSRVLNLFILLSIIYNENSHNTEIPRVIDSQYSSQLVRCVVSIAYYIVAFIGR